MTKAAKIVYLVALAIGLAAGSAAGFLSTMNRLRFSDKATRDIAPRLLYDFSLIQYQHADAGHARDAAQLAVNFLTELEDLQPAGEQEIELAASYTRLAILADQAGDPERSRVLLSEAGRYFKSASGRDYSADEMKAWLKALDDLRTTVSRRLAQDNLR